MHWLVLFSILSIIAVVLVVKHKGVKFPVQSFTSSELYIAVQPVQSKQPTIPFSLVEHSQFTDKVVALAKKVDPVFTKPVGL